MKKTIYMLVFVTVLAVNAFCNNISFSINNWLNDEQDTGITFYYSQGGATSAVSAMLMETGDYMLMETGDKILLE